MSVPESIAPVEAATERAQRFLLERQNEDGLWRDYLLPPGPSTSWVTACVALALTGCKLHGAEAQLKKAEEVLVKQQRLDGWGYNSSVACDADSTAAVLRFLARQGNPVSEDALLLLRSYINDDGGVRTFGNRARFGRWAEPHAEVVPAVGLALHECGADSDQIHQLRTWSLQHQEADGSWKEFWWATRLYSTAKNLSFLDQSGGLPLCRLRGSQQWLSEQSDPETSIDAACAVTIAGPHSDRLDVQANRILRQQDADGSWPASPLLLVPDQWRSSSETHVYADLNRLMSTATCLAALASAL